ncbi:protein DOUBLE-STRAND BREAK FORMATION isoform X2 [Malania oleifera]|uniref:protein DOUBLE-STRAND BREAK FORMATION isoform X2 n=1 Tax=Malania oleifera TaxID=397392 RepID=UPI0025AEC004|nr:protein DOUBLE-STRAND BREAK FORMATION isoform X2 [Malania oleifera]
MPNGVAEQISVLGSHVKSRRFDQGTLRLLEFILVSNDVKSSLEVRSSLREFMSSECLRVVREIAEKTVDEKLLIIDFFVRAFALAGDVESCLALRYEALALRELNSTRYNGLQVSYREWLTFAEHSLDKGYYSITRKACEKALSCIHVNDSVDAETDGSSENTQVTEKIKRLMDVAVASSASRSGTGSRLLEKERNWRQQQPKELFSWPTRSVLGKHSVQKRN